MAFDAIAPDVPGRLAGNLALVVEQEVGVPLLGVGVGVPGIVDSPDMGNVDADVLGWSVCRWADTCAERLDFQSRGKRRQRSWGGRAAVWKGRSRHDFQW